MLPTEAYDELKTQLSFERLSTLQTNLEAYDKFKEQFVKGTHVLIVDGKFVASNADKYPLLEMIKSDCLLQRVGYEDVVHEI